MSLLSVPKPRLEKRHSAPAPAPPSLRPLIARAEAVNLLVLDVVAALRKSTRASEAPLDSLPFALKLHGQRLLKRAAGGADDSATPCLSCVTSPNALGQLAVEIADAKQKIFDEKIRAETKPLAEALAKLEAVAEEFEGIRRMLAGMGAGVVGFQNGVKNVAADEDAVDDLAATLMEFLGKEEVVGEQLKLVVSSQRHVLRLCLSTLDSTASSFSSSSSSSSSSIRRVFRVPLSRHLRDAGRDVAAPLEECCCVLWQLGLETEGLLRMEGRSTRMRRIVAAFDFCDEVDWNSIKLDPHSVAGVLKLYLRELPDPLLTFELYDEFVSIADFFLNDLEVGDQTFDVAEASRVDIAAETANATANATDDSTPIENSNVTTELSQSTNDGHKKTTPDHDSNTTLSLPPFDGPSTSSSSSSSSASTPVTPSAPTHPLSLFRRLLLRLPPDNLANLRYLAAFLARLTRHAHANMMTPYNVSVVMGTNLLRHPTEEATTLRDVRRINKLVETLVARTEELLPGAEFAPEKLLQPRRRRGSSSSMPDLAGAGEGVVVDGEGRSGQSGLAKERGFHSMRRLSVEKEVKIKKWFSQRFA